MFAPPAPAMIRDAKRRNRTSRDVLRTAARMVQERLFVVRRRSLVVVTSTNYEQRTKNLATRPLRYRRNSGLRRRRRARGLRLRAGEGLRVPHRPAALR